MYIYPHVYTRIHGISWGRSKREVSKFGIRGIYALIENDIWLREDSRVKLELNFEREEIKWFGNFFEQNNFLFILLLSVKIYYSVFLLLSIDYSS